MSKTLLILKYICAAVALITPFLLFGEFLVSGSASLGGYQVVHYANGYKIITYVVLIILAGLVILPNWKTYYVNIASSFVMLLCGIMFLCLPFMIAKNYTPGIFSIIIFVLDVLASITLFVSSYIGIKKKVPFISFAKSSK
jgi:hypothetical protein